MARRFVQLSLSHHICVPRSRPCFFGGDAAIRTQAYAETVHSVALRSKASQYRRQASGNQAKERKGSGCIPFPREDSGYNSVSTRTESRNESHGFLYLAAPAQQRLRGKEAEEIWVTKGVTRRKSRTTQYAPPGPIDCCYCDPSRLTMS